MSECKSARQLNVPRRSYTTIPGSESAASDVRTEHASACAEIATRLEGVPIPDIEEFTTQFEFETFGYRCVLVKCEIPVVIGKCAHVAHPRPLPEIESVEAADRLEGGYVEEW